MIDATRVLLLIFDDVDLLDVGGPYEVFLTANRLVGRDGEAEPFQVIPVSLDGEAHSAYGGLGLVPDSALHDTTGEVLVVPGLVDVPAALNNERLIASIESSAESVELVASVCTGALLLAKAGLLDGLIATTHFEDVEQLAQLIGPDNAVTARWIDAGAVVTAGGLSNGMAMALHLVHRLHSLELAQRTARQIEYPWHPHGGETVKPES